MFDELTATLSVALLVTTPAVVKLSQVVLSEVPTLALMLGAFYYLGRYAADKARSALAGFIVCAVLSLYAKQVAIFMLPVYALYLGTALGPRALFSRRIFGVGLVVVLLALPLVPMTVWLSPYNLSVVTAGAPPAVASQAPAAPSGESTWALPWEEPPTPDGFTNSLGRYLQYVGDYATSVLLALAAAGLLTGLVRQDRKLLLPVAWIVVLLVELSALAYPVQRLAIYLVPPLCLLAASFVNWSGPRTRLAAVIIVLGAVGYQSVLASRVVPDGAEGYEEAATEIVARGSDHAVLYSAVIDSGYFVFFVRKHDPDRRMVVLRADKLLTTSRMQIPNVRDLVFDREQIPTLLREYGVRYVVIEDAPYPSGPLTWLQEDVTSDAFRLLRRIPIRSHFPRLRSVTVSLYEFTGYTTAADSAVLDLELPLINRSISVPLRDLLSPSVVR
jgi:4-amino-4-deoxy-L-arabinose transferase-like glycosyltransferase